VKTKKSRIVTDMKKITALLSAIVLSLMLTSCGLLESRYRYECHDPENWYNKECNPPTCLAYGECTKDILGFDPTEGSVNE
jgi:hypothetical protein